MLGLSVLLTAATVAGVHLKQLQDRQVGVTWPRLPGRGARCGPCAWWPGPASRALRFPRPLPCHEAQGWAEASGQGCIPEFEPWWGGHEALGHHGPSYPR